MCVCMCIGSARQFEIYQTVSSCFHACITSLVALIKAIYIYKRKRERERERERGREREFMLL